MSSVYLTRSEICDIFNIIKHKRTYAIIENIFRKAYIIANGKKYFSKNAVMIFKGNLIKQGKTFKEIVSEYPSEVDLKTMPTSKAERSENRKKLRLQKLEQRYEALFQKHPELILKDNVFDVAKISRYLKRSDPSVRNDLRLFYKAKNRTNRGRNDRDNDLKFKEFLSDPNNFKKFTWQDKSLKIIALSKELEMSPTTIMYLVDKHFPQNRRKNKNKG